ncbi:MAG: alkylhydroperoxidase family enzyme [Candidatus Paceibacteria bacterium]|jgi:alkylhydroperoxidase family enzyme
MTWIQTTELKDASGDLKELYARAVDPESGQLDNIISIHSSHPAGLAAHLDLYGAVMRGTPSLRKVEREMIALVVSLQNGCHY